MRNSFKSVGAIAFAVTTAVVVANSLADAEIDISRSDKQSQRPWQSQLGSMMRSVAAAVSPPVAYSHQTPEYSIVERGRRVRST